MTDRETARQQVADLVARYRALPPTRRTALNENELRHSFILPLFTALGWNTADPDQMTAEEEISRKKVDFGFYIQRIPAFYVETKRLRAGVENPEFIKQAINYAYLKGVTWAVLTHFESLRVYNASADTAPDRARFINLHWEQYADSGFDDLWLLSRPSMSQRPRPIDQKAEQYGNLIPRRPVTELLFDNLTDWRSRLYQQFRTHLPPLLPVDSHEIDNAVQKLLDRLIFLRAAEDRGVEAPLLRPLLNQNNRGQWWAALRALFREMNTYYNSNLFQHHALDEMEMHDPDLLKEMIDGLYQFNRNLAFDFNAMDADVLGAAYEQYLGHKQRSGGKITIETSARQRKRRMQGIYYTPKPIVRYIVQQTLGQRLQAGADPYALRVLDPACGSGSFLITAFDVLDSWLATHDPATPVHERRRRILSDCLYGVDLDDQAVEVTRLNLVLRAALEPRVKLPMLDHIQQGDSVMEDSAASEHPFIWRNRFASVMDAGGFDVILGNPPYVRSGLLTAAFKTAAASRYTTASGNADLYVYFIEQSIRLLREGGVYGVIVANKWMRAGYGEGLRDFLRPHVREIVDFGDLPVFADATTYPAIVIAEKTPPTSESLKSTQVESLDYHDLADHVAEHQYSVPRTALKASGWSLGSASEEGILTKARALGIPLAEYLPSRIRRGVVTGLNEAFIISAGKRDELVRRDPACAALIKPFIVGADIKRYHTEFDNKHLICIPKGWTNAQAGDAADKWKWLQETLPILAAHLAPFAVRAAKRGDKGDYWWELRACDYYPEFEQPKIIYPDIAVRGQYTFDEHSHYMGDTTFFFNSTDKYLLGLLNSR